MCPRAPIPGDNQSSSVNLAAWSEQARCSIAIFRRHTTSQIIICDHCFLTVSAHDRILYEHVVRHYITIGDDSRFEECSFCFRVLVGTIPVREATCGECPGILRGFLEYITRHDLRPFNDIEPTIIVIRQFRV